MADRQEFPVKIRLAAWQRANGVCECGCERPFGKHPKERPEYDHAVEASLGGDNSLENCRCIRADCHAAKTSDRAPALAKARRGEKDLAGLKPKPKRRLPGARGSKWKSKIGGTWEQRT